MQADTRAELDRRYARTATAVDRLEALEPGPTMVSGLSALRAEAADAPTAIRIHALWEKVIAWSSAQQMLASHDALNCAGYLPDLDEISQIQIVAQEIAAATHTSLTSAHIHVDLVLGAAGSLGASWEALDRGELTLAHYKALNRVTAHSLPRVVAAVDAQVVPLAVARGWTPSELAKHARKVMIAVDPDGAAARAEVAKAHGDVCFYPDVDETASLNANGDAVLLREVFDTVNDRAAQMGRAGDNRPVGVRRLAALADAVLNTPLVGIDGAGTDDRRTTSRAGRRHADIVVDLPTALGLADNPGELAGYGPISADTAREIAKDATLRRLVTDPINGRCIDLGRTSYRPSEALRRFVAARDRVCTFPGCARPAIDCECDHRKDWRRHGRTDGDNLQSLCKLHHSLKTKKLWQVTLDNDGHDIWTSPFGFRYRRREDSYPIEQLEPSDDDDITDDASEVLSGDPDPPHEDDPLPESPDLTLEEYLTYSDDLERVAFRAACFNYDQFYAEQRVS